MTKIDSPYTFRNNAIIARMSESDPSGAVDVDTEVGAGEDNIHSGRTGNRNISQVVRKSSCL